MATLSRGNFSSQPVSSTTMVQVWASLMKLRDSEPGCTEPMLRMMFSTNCPGEYTCTLWAVKGERWAPLLSWVPVDIRSAMASVTASPPDGKVCMPRARPSSSNSLHRGSNSGKVG